MADWTGGCFIDKGGEIGRVATLQGFECVFRNILQVVAQLGVILLFIMLIMGGFKYMTAGGDPKASASASGTLTYAIFGLVLLIIIWLIMKFIFDFTGVDVLNFSIPGS